MTSTAAGFATTVLPSDPVSARAVEAAMASSALLFAYTLRSSFALPTKVSLVEAEVGSRLHVTCCAWGGGGGEGRREHRAYIL